MIAILAIGAALAGLVWQSQHGRRDDLSGRLREAKKDQERLRADINRQIDRFDGQMDRLDGPMARIEGRMTRLDGWVDGTQGVLRDYGEPHLADRGRAPAASRSQPRHSAAVRSGRVAVPASERP